MIYARELVLKVIKDLQFMPPGTTPAHVLGKMYYDADVKGLSVHMGITGVTLQMGQEFYELVYNDSGVQIDNGMGVYRSGTNAANLIPEVELTDASDPTKSLNFAGVATHDIPNGTIGLITKCGHVRDMDTSMLSLVGPIYLSTTPGVFTNTAPIAPNQRIVVGGVMKVDPTVGAILVDISLALQPHLIAKDYSFTSQGIGAGTYYRGGFYDAPVADANLTQASTTVTYGAANQAVAAHAFIVAGAAGVVASGQVGIRVNGISITDAGVRTAGDSEVLTTDITTLATDQYVETSKKWLGQPTWELYVVSGSPATYSLDFNYGFCKYEDLVNVDFVIAAIEVVGLAGANDSSFDIELLHHKNTGWIYHASAFVPGNGPIARWSTDMSPDDNLVNGKHFAWEHTEINQLIEGAVNEEGIIIRITTGQNNSVQSMDMHLSTFVEPT